MPITSTRRRFVAGLSLAGAGVVYVPKLLAGEDRPETTAVRLAKKIPVLCNAPQYIADELLRAEGFSDIQYVVSGPGAALTRKIADGAIDFSMGYAGPNIIAVDAGEAIVNLAGVHVGCFELLGREGIRSIADLKGKSIGITALGSSEHVYLAAMLAHIGLDPNRDVNWVTSASPPVSELFAGGEVDAFLGFAPTPQDLRARHIGRVIVNSAVDRPWSQYFCCMLIANREFVRKYPIATKRVLRAILKATDYCASEPAAVARRLVDGGFAERYDYAVQGLSELPFDKWREYDAEDTIRFYALRLHEAGMIKSNPNTIIAKGTDWRFLNELKRELKA
jgi:NitT/TauT family transport system substrate-binding protein